MIKYYNSLSWRLGTQLKTREPAASERGSKCKTRPYQLWLVQLFLVLGLLFSSDVTAQFTYSQNFNTDAGSFTGDFLRFTGATACGGSGGAMRRNIYSSAPTGQLISPSVGTSTGGATTVTFSYKIANWSANTIGTGAGWGSFNVQYGSSASGPWTTVFTVNGSNHVTSGNCASFTTPSFNPPAGALFVRFSATFGSSGDYYLNFDDISVTQLAPPSCTGQPNAGAVVANTTSGCSGQTLTLSSSGLSVGLGISYQWQSSPDNSAWSPIPSANGTSYTTPSVAGLTYYRLVTTCSGSGLSNESNAVSFNGISCGSLNIPASGSTTVSCGSSTLLYDNGGPSGQYTNGNTGFVVLENSGTGVITLSGSIAGFETCCDGLRIYSGIGTGGTLLATLSAAGAITPIVSAPGQALTVQLFSDGSVVGDGIALQAVYSGTCASCSGTPGSLSIAFTSATSGNLSWTAPSPAPADGYEWAVTTSAIPPASGTATTDLTAVATSLTSGQNYYLHVRSNCGGGEFSSWSTSSAFTTPFSCGDVFVDSGGAGGSYSNSENLSYLFVPSNPGESIQLTFTAFGTEACCDFLRVYDGPTAASPLLGTFGGTTIPGPFISSHPSGQLFVVFTSDSSVTGIGWSANVACLLPCSGTPEGGLVNVASQSVCPAFPVAPITAAGATNGLGITYQWEESVDSGTSWANATGGTGATTTTYQPPVFVGATILYRLKVTCSASGLEDFSDTSEVNQNPNPVPFTEDFSDLSTLVGWSTTGFGIGSVRGATGNPGDNASINLWSSTPTGQITTAKHGPVQSGQAVVFDYQATDFGFAPPYPTTVANSGTIQVSVSTDCGATFTVIDTFNNEGIAGYTTRVVSLGAYVGQDVLVRITGTLITGDFDLSIDNFGILVPPPSIVSFDPLAVCEESGTLVTITGDFFNDVSSVTLGATPVSFNVVDVNTITFNLPSGVSTGAISVTTPGGTATSSTDLAVNANPVVNPITGADTALCMPSTLLLASTSPGGTWSSSNEAVATVVGGTVTGVMEGSVTISYSVTDNGCTTTVTYDVDVNEPVVISSFTASQTVVTGNDATFSVTATGSGLAYQWFAFDGIDTYELDDSLSLFGESYSGSTTSSLVVGSVPGDMNLFEFYCEVSGVAPCTTETTTPNSILNVGDTGIGSDPSNVTLCDGGSTTFTVVRSGDDLEESITYAWEYDADGTDDWQPVVDGDLDGMTIADSDTSVLSVSTITLVHNAYRFRAVVTGPANAATSNPATLTVNEGVSFSSQPESALVCRVATAATFNVTAAGAATGIQWESSPNGVDTWTNVGTGASLNVAVTPATPVGVTYYRAVVSGTTPCLPVNSDVVTLTVQQPTISVTPSSATYCLPGEAVSLTASGAATYTWSPATGLSATSGATVLASPTTTTTYTVTGIDANGCSNTTNVTVSVSSQITGDATANLVEVCAEDPVQLGIVPTQVLPSYPINSALYRFEASSGVFTPLVGGTSSGLAATSDDNNSGLLPIGFSFNYGGTNYTNFRVNSNGLMVFNPTGNTAAFNDLATTTATQRTSLAPLWDDLQCTSGVTYQVSGTAPNRVLTVQWLNMEWNWNSTVGISFQVKLYEGTNTIEYVYRPEAGGNPTGSSGASIGLMGTAATNFVSLSNSSAAPSVSTTTATNNIGVKPASGQIYRFIPTAPVTYTYAWSSTPEGFTSTAQNPTVNPSETTTYSVVVTSSAGCTLTSDITVNVVSGAVIDEQPVSLAQCEGTDASFTVAASGPSLAYQWRKDGVAIDGATAATLALTNISETDDASYDVVITPLCGDAVTSDAVSLTVNLLPTAGASNSGTTCEGGEVTLSATSDIPGSTFAWTGPNGFSSTEQNPVLANVTTANAGVYTVTVTSPAICSSTATTTVSITANGPLTIAASGSATTACVGELKMLTASATSVGSTTVSFGSNLQSNGTVAATFPATITGIPAGAIVTSAQLQFTNVNAINGSWRSEIRVALTGAHVLGATQISTLGSGGLISPDPTVNVTGFTATSGTVNLVLTETFNDGGDAIDATFGTAVLVINYALPAPSVTWTPATDLYTDAAGTVPYTGASATTVYAKVSATSPTSYTASSVNVLGCEREATYSYALTTTGCPSTTVVQPSQCGVTLDAINSFVYANIVSGAQGYRFRVTNMTTNEVQTIDQLLRGFRLTQLTSFAFNTTYMVEVAVRRNNVWESFYGTGCTVTTPDTTTQVQASQCNTTLSNLNNSIIANIVPFATGYRFRITNTLNPIDVQTIDRPIRDFRMSSLSNIQFNTTYNVEVAVRNTDGTY
ncbi:CUB domain-containing protein, partial [Flavobacterium lacus]